MSIEELQKIIASLRRTIASDVVMTPYDLAKLVNSTFELKLPPQMFYNYVRKGFISVVERNGRKVVEKKEVIAFIERYARRNLVSSVS